MPKRLRIRSLTDPDTPFRQQVWGNRYRIERKFRKLRGSSSSISMSSSSLSSSSSSFSSSSSSFSSSSSSSSSTSSSSSSSSSTILCFGIGSATIGSTFIVGCNELFSSSSSSSSSSLAPIATSLNIAITPEVLRTDGNPIQYYYANFVQDLTPKAAIFEVVNNTQYETIQTNSVYSIGFTDGTTDCSCAGVIQDQNMFSARSVSINDRCISIFDPNTLQLTAAAVFYEFGTNYVAVSWNPIPPEDYLIKVTMIANTGLQVEVGDFYFPSGSTGAATAIEVGFDPDQVFFISTASYFNQFTGNAQSYPYNSHTLKYDATMQWSVASKATNLSPAIDWCTHSAALTSTSFSNPVFSPRTGTFDNRLMQVYQGIGSLDTYSTSAFYVSGISIERTNGTGDNHAFYMALKWNNLVYRSGFYNASGSGQQTYNVPRLYPEYIMHVPYYFGNINSSYIEQGMLSNSFTEQHHVSYAFLKGNDTSTPEIRSFAALSAASSFDRAGGTNILNRAEFVQFTNQGFVLDWQVGPTNDDEPFPYIAVGVSSSSSSNSSSSSTSSSSSSPNSSSSSSNGCNEVRSYYTGVSGRENIVQEYYPDITSPFYLPPVFLTSAVSAWEDPEVFVLEWKSQAQLSAIQLPLIYTHPVLSPPGTGISDPEDFETCQFNLSVYESPIGPSSASNVWTFMEFVSVCVPSSVNTTFELTNFVFNTPLATTSGNYYAVAIQQPYWREDLWDRTGVVTASARLGIIIQGLSTDVHGTDFDTEYRDWEYKLTTLEWPAVEDVNFYISTEPNQFSTDHWYHYGIGIVVDNACASSSSSTSNSSSSSSSSSTSNSSSSTSSSSSSSASGVAESCPFESATVEADGATVTIVFNEAMQLGIGGGDGMSIDNTIASGMFETPQPLSYVSGDGTDTWTFSIDIGTVGEGESPELSFTDPGLSILNGAMEPLDEFSGCPMTNNSEVIIG